jgi:hypothetical protein
MQVFSIQVFKHNPNQNDSHQAYKGITYNCTNSISGVVSTQNSRSHDIKIYNFQKMLGVLVGTRTLDPLIKSQLLYQLSYEDKLVVQMYKTDVEIYVQIKYSL